METPNSSLGDTMSPAITAAQIEAYLTTAQHLHRSARDHLRYKLRSRSLIAILGGSVLNFVCLLVAFISDEANAPKHVVVWTGIVVSLLAAFKMSCLRSCAQTTSLRRNILLGTLCPRYGTLTETMRCTVLPFSKLSTLRFSQQPKTLNAKDEKRRQPSATYIVETYSQRLRLWP